MQAKAHWMDALDPNNIPTEQQDMYNARTQVGDVIVVRPDGWVWGNEECPPRYIVIKRPDLSVEDARYLEEPLTDTATVSTNTPSTSVEMTTETGGKIILTNSKVGNMSDNSIVSVDVVPTEPSLNVHPKMLKVRRYSIDPAIVEDAIAQQKTEILNTTDANIEEKVE